MNTPVDKTHGLKSPVRETGKKRHNDLIGSVTRLVDAAADLTYMAILHIRWFQSLFGT